MEKERFSLRLLEPNEIYFEDFLVNLLDENTINMTTTVETPTTEGHLKMCSKSIVFDPKNKLEPIIKIQYKDCDELYQWPITLKSHFTNVLAVSCTQYTEMLKDNIIAPYNFKLERRLFLFNLLYDTVENNLNQLCQLHRASSLPVFDQNDMIATIVYSRLKRIKFNPLWLDNIYEKIIATKTVDEINPLIINPGQLLLSSKSIYFQPYNNIQRYPVKKIPLANITSMIQRRFLLRHTSLEIKWKQELSNSLEETLYVAFSKPNERSEFFKLACEQNLLKLAVSEQHSMTLKWQNRIISNYDYLLYLNSLADRTFQDLTQYPVFPWIINDYTSKSIDLSDERIYRDLKKPMGAINVERLARLKERYEEMDEPKFLYGSHYSAPGFVLFYLVRKYPQLMLCLQNGRFDYPDRMFNSINDTFRNCLNNMSDFKELIPEFYDTNTRGDFLINQSKTNFGIRQDGTPVNNVQLPPWADNSPEKFVNILRNALESDYVSANLNHWIDLVFGYKQRGDNALKADNVFYHLCYEGSVDLDAVTELTKRHMLEVQISEFGQIPKQLFDKPHVPKLNPINFERQLSSTSDIQSPPPPPLSSSSSTASASFLFQSTNNILEKPSNSENLSITSPCDNIINEIIFYDDGPSHKDIINCMIYDENGIIISAGKDGLMKIYNVDERRQKRCATIGSLPLSCCAKIDNSNTIVLASWDNTIMTYDLDYCKISIVLPAHDDAVSCLKIINEIGVVISGSWDCSVKVWRGFNAINSFRLSSAMIAYYSFEEKISTLDAYLNGNTLKIVIGTFAGEVHLWSLEILDDSNEIISQPETIQTKLLYSHCPSTNVLAVAFNCRGTEVASVSADCTLNVCDITSGMTLIHYKHNSMFTCLNWSYSNECLLLGDKCGRIFVLNMLIGAVHLERKIFNEFISSITVSKQLNQIAVAGIDNRREFLLKIWNFSTVSARELSLGELK